MAVTRFVSDKNMTFDFVLNLGLGNINFVCDTPSYFALSFCEV